MNQQHINNTKDGARYAFATVTDANAFGIDADTPTPVTIVLHAQTVYLNSLDTFIEVNLAIQSAVDHLTLTQMGMNAGIKIWGKDSVKAIIREMKKITIVKLSVPCYQKR